MTAFYYMQYHMIVQLCVQDPVIDVVVEILKRCSMQYNLSQ